MGQEVIRLPRVDLKGELAERFVKLKKELEGELGFKPSNAAVVRHLLKEYRNVELSNTLASSENTIIEIRERLRMLDEDTRLFKRDHEEIKKMMNERDVEYERLRILVELTQIQAGILQTDQTDCRIVYANNKMSEILGYPLEELIGKYYTSLIDEREIADYEKEKRNTKQKKRSIHRRTMRRKDGTLIPTLHTAGREGALSVEVITELPPSRIKTEES